MPDDDRLSRELREEELPEEAHEELAEARTVHRARPLTGRAGGSEERSGTETVPQDEPVVEERPPIKPPPLELPEK
jgi:hypothetical protein